jgi:hypothetical protein
MISKTVFSNVIVAIITALILALSGWAAGVFKAGEDALTEQQIKAVMMEIMKADIDGETLTYGQALSRIDSRLSTMEGALETLTKP